MPTEVYFAMSRGVFLPLRINPIIQGSFAVSSPSVDSEEYRSALRESRLITERTLVLFLLPLPFEFISKQVKVHYWYHVDAKGEPLDLSGQYSKIETLPWKLSSEVFQKESTRQGISTVDLNFVVKFLLADTSDGSNLPKFREMEFLSEEQILAQTMANSLALMGFDESDAQRTAYARGLSFVSSANLPFAILVTKLLHFGVLHSNPLELHGTTSSMCNPILTSLISLERGYQLLHRKMGKYC